MSPSPRSVTAASIRGDRTCGRLAAYPNVVCKLSGLATIAAPGWRPAELLPYLRYALNAFGPARCMFGSDWPVCLLNTTL